MLSYPFSSIFGQNYDLMVLYVFSLPSIFLKPTERKTIPIPFPLLSTLARTSIWKRKFKESSLYPTRGFLMYVCILVELKHINFSKSITMNQTTLRPNKNKNKNKLHLRNQQTRIFLKKKLIMRSIGHAKIFKFFFF